jgi:hypothetical protein
MTEPVTLFDPQQAEEQAMVRIKRFIASATKKAPANEFARTFEFG